jgi:hypothetical protein
MTNSSILNEMRALRSLLGHMNVASQEHLKNLDTALEASKKVIDEILRR